MERKNLGFCKQIEQWEGLYYIKIMIETLIFIKERMPLIIDMACLTLLVLVFSNLKFKIFVQLIRASHRLATSYPKSLIIYDLLLKYYENVINIAPL